MRALIASQLPRVSPNSSGNASMGDRPDRVNVDSKSRSRRKRGRQNGGFTLVELLVIWAILMTITAIAVPSLMAAIDQAKITKAVGDMNAIETNIAWCQTIYGQLPDDLSVAVWELTL